MYARRHDEPMDWSEIELLLRDESSTVEWKRNVADSEDVAKTLTAFANAIEQRGGGVVICGVEEHTDASGARVSVAVGLSPDRLNELRRRVPALLREHATPPIIPHIDVADIPDDPQRKILLFRVEPSPHAVAFRHKKHGTHYFIRVDDRTQRANGRVEQLLRLKRVWPPLMEDVHHDATMRDLDQLVIREYLERMDLPQPWETYLEPDTAIEGGIPSLITLSSTGDGEARAVPRNFALLLFGLEPRRFFRGACAVLSAYPGIDRAASSSDLVPDVTGPLPEMIRKVLDWLKVHIGMVVDKSETVSSGRQNRPRYARRAVEEAVVNAFVHRDYSVSEPVRVTVFADRLEVTSPGGLMQGVNPEKLRNGLAVPKWRNDALASFMLRLGMAQNRGEGVPVILRETRELTGLEPTLDTDGQHFTVVLPALRPRIGGDEAPARPQARGGDALLLVAVGASSVREQVNASLPNLGLADAPIVIDHESPGYLESADWETEAREIRDALRAVVDRPEHRHFHLFYRGPVVLAPLIGALVAPAKPLHIYTFDDGRYVYAHTVDKKFLRG